MIGKRVKIKEKNCIVSELWNCEGTIKKSREIDHSESRVWYVRSEPQCPNEIVYWLEFDEPVSKDGNLLGWLGVWVKEPDVIVC